MAEELEGGELGKLGVRWGIDTKTEEVEGVDDELENLVGTRKRAVGSLENVFSLLCLMLEDNSSGFLKIWRFFGDCDRGGIIRGGG